MALTSRKFAYFQELKSEFVKVLPLHLRLLAVKLEAAADLGNNCLSCALLKSASLESATLSRACCFYGLDEFGLQLKALEDMLSKLENLNDDPSYHLRITRRIILEWSAKLTIDLQVKSNSESSEELKVMLAS